MHAGVERRQSFEESRGGSDGDASRTPEQIIAEGVLRANEKKAGEVRGGKEEKKKKGKARENGVRDGDPS